MDMAYWKFLKLLTLGLSGFFIGTGIRYKLKARKMREEEKRKKEFAKWGLKK